MPLIIFSRLGCMLSAFFPPLMSPSMISLIPSALLIISIWTTPTAHLKTWSLYLAEHLKHIDGRRQAGSRHAVWQQNPSVWSQNSGQHSSPQRTSEKKRIMGIPTESKCKAGTWLKATRQELFLELGAKVRGGLAFRLTSC